MLRTVSAESGAPPPYEASTMFRSPAPSTAISSLYSDISDGHTYQYSSKAVSMSFSQPIIEGVRFPAYGSEGIVAGEVSLRSSSFIDSITISLRGQIKTIIESTCRPTLSSTADLFESNHVLWTKSNNDVSTAPCLFPFSMRFPKTTMAKDHRTPLPPSFIGATVGGTIRVEYKVVVLVRRLGWRSNQSLKTKIFYLPRLEGTDHCSPSWLSSSNQVPMGSPYDFRVVSLIANQTVAGRSAPSMINAHLACPSLVSLARSHSIPFNIWLSSPEHSSGSFQTLAPHISIYIVRVVSVTARGSTTIEKTIISQQNVQVYKTLDKPESQVLNLSGRLNIPSDAWRSWTVPGAGSVAYSLNISLPVSTRPDIAFVDHTEPFLLVAGNGVNCNLPGAPDLEAMPSPASLLKGTTFYVPMRV